MAGTQAIEVMKGMAKSVRHNEEYHNPFNSMPLQELINPITGKINPDSPTKIS